MQLSLIFVLWCATMTAASLAEAHSFELGVEQQIEGQSNLLGSLSDTVADGTYRLRPKFDLSGDFGEIGIGQYRISYRPSYIGYFRTEGINGLENRANGNAVFDVTRRDRLQASASYTEYRAIQAISELNPDGSFDVLASDRGISIRAFAALGYSRSLSGRSNLSFNMDFQDYAYTESNNVGNKAVGFTIASTRAANRRLTLGGNAVIRHRIFDAQEGDGAVLSVGSASVTIANVNLLGSYELSRNWKFDFAGGPSLIRTKPGRVEGFSQRDPDEDLTYFANLSLNRRFKRAALELTYRRNEDASGGSRRTAVIDSVFIALSVDADQFWKMTARAGWSRRATVDNLLFIDPTSGLPVPVARQSRIDQVWTSVSASRRLDERVNLILIFRYQSWTENRTGNVSQPNQDNYSGSLILTYDFDPYVF